MKENERNHLIYICFIEQSKFVFYNLTNKSTKDDNEKYNKMLNFEKK